MVSTVENSGLRLQSYSSLVQQAGSQSCQTVIQNALARAKKSAELEARFLLRSLISLAQIQGTCISLYICVCVCMSVCTYACMSGCLRMYVCKYVCMYVVMHAYKDGWKEGRMDGWMDKVFLHVYTRDMYLSTCPSTFRSIYWPSEPRMCEALPRELNMCLNTCMDVYIACMYTCMCVRIYIRIYTHTHTHHSIRGHVDVRLHPQSVNSVIIV